MNRIIIIGNGFDLAHGLKTSYRDFIDWFWEKSIDRFKIDAFRENFVFPFSDVVSFTCHYDLDTYPSYEIEVKKRDRNYGTMPTKRDVNVSIKDSTSQLTDKIKKIIDKKFSVQDWADIEKRIEGESCYSIEAVKVKCKNKFLKIISENLSLQNWVDIEEEYYKLLQEIILNKKNLANNRNYTDIRRLNNDFSCIKEELVNYLVEETTKAIGGNAIESVNAVIDNNIYSHFERHDLTESALSSIPKLILFLSFNYSNTEELYSKQLHNDFLSTRREIIHIHGELRKTTNPIIFGYGDDIGKEYDEIVNLNDNDFLENIKSIRYSDTRNYKKLLDLIDSDKYQIFLFGHSCGLSDRALLNTLFEHKNCVSIKPFYHKRNDDTDNYSDIVRNISRHFKDKAVMRKKIVNKEYCKPLL